MPQGHKNPAIDAIVARLVKAFPDHSARSLAKRLVAETNGALTLETARSKIRDYWGLRGKGNRRWAKGSRPPRSPGQTLSMPESWAQPWTRHVLNVVGQVGILSDVHVPYHDEIALRAAVDRLAGEQLDALVLNGDICDFYGISRWEKDPSKRDFKGELQAVRDFIAWIRGEFPSIPIILKEGNHEYRWKSWLYQHAPEIADEPMMSLVAWLKLGDHGVELVEDQRPIMLGKLPVLHGHELPKGLAAPVNVARGAFLRTLTSVLVGHSHRSSGHAESDLWHNETFCWSTGCLCDLTPEYARINRWNHGAAIVTVHADGEFDVHNFRIAHGKVRSS
jgi:predicted phosphodiesterase